MSETDRATASTSGGSDSSPAARARPRLNRIASHPLAHLALAFLVLALVQGFLVKLYQVPSESMEPTLHVDGVQSDRFLVNRLAYQGASEDRGDVIVFAKPDAWGVTERSSLRQAIGVVGDLLGIGPSNQDPLVKRVIGVGGDRIECCSADGRIVVNGEPIDEPYVVYDLPFEAGRLDCDSAQRSQRCFDEITVPAGELLVLGDNRANSSDSVVACRGSTDQGQACARFVPQSDVVGEAFLIVYPFNRWGQQLQEDPS